MKMIKIAICDDEQVQRMLMKSMVRKYLEGAHIEAEINEYETSEDFLNEGGDVDVALLDIYMPGLTGIELAQQLRAQGNQCGIIFITGGNEFASEAFEVESLSYLQKPVEYERFQKVMDRAMRGFARTSAIEITENRETILVYVSDILFIETMARKLVLHTLARDYETYYALSKMIEMLPSGEFVQISRFVLVALKQIKSMTDKELILTDGTELQIGSKYEKDVISKYEAYKRRA
ncbi:MAG: LytTR family DNA-binding domain-containing protein [Lachnospiraceae bacterium]|nr:LytTR family DNA-binding domain-containing protein [Lachnospiraceae bacterium]